MRKRLVILLADGEPELMYKMADHLALIVDEAVATLTDDRAVQVIPNTGERADEKKDVAAKKKGGVYHE